MADTLTARFKCCSVTRFDNGSEMAELEFVPPDGEGEQAFASARVSLCAGEDCGALGFFDAGEHYSLSIARDA